MRAVLKLAQYLPPRLLNGVGRLQYSYPALRPLIEWASKPLRSGEAVIRYGVGKGLKFDPSGSNPGYAVGSVSAAEQQALARYLQPGDVFYDIGANVGFFAVIGARLVGPAGRVYAFEPFPESIEAIRSNAARNDFGHLTALQCAVSRERGSGVLLLEGGSMTFRLAPAIPASGRDGATVVTIVAIDDLVGTKRIEPPGLVMIDVEGAEIDVLEGMRHTLEAHLPVVICEVHGLGPRFTEVSSRICEPLGYTVTQLDGSAVPEGTSRYHALMLPPSRRC